MWHHRGVRRAPLVWLFAVACAAEPTPPAALPVPVVERPVQRARLNGVELAWDDFGDRAAPPLLLIMGLGMQMIAWDETLCTALAARGFHVIRFDNRDVGLSSSFDDAGDPNLLARWDALSRRRPVAPPPYQLADMADDAAALLESLALPPAHIVGVSLGGMIAQELALRHPERVRTLASIMSTTGDRQLRGPSFEVIAELLRPFPPDREGFVARSVEVARVLHGPGFVFDEEAARRLAARSWDRARSHTGPAGARRQLEAIWAAPDRTAALGQLRRPTLVIHGDADPLIPVDAGRATARAIPGAILSIIPGLGHELPRALQPRLVEAIAQLAQR
jgi:pimeloyl-ACP methyl ester carboxylesterase